MTLNTIPQSRPFIPISQSFIRLNCSHSGPTSCKHQLQKAEYNDEDVRVHAKEAVVTSRHAVVFDGLLLRQRWGFGEDNAQWQGLPRQVFAGVARLVIESARDVAWYG